jgi:hypothetical protein
MARYANDCTRYMTSSTEDKWQILVRCRGTTWPSHGLQRGTLLLVEWFKCKNIIEVRGV